MSSSAGGSTDRRRRPAPPNATADRLTSLVRALETDDGVRQVSRTLLARGIASTGATGGICVVVSHDGRELELVASTGWPDALLAPWTRFSVQQQVPVAEAVRTCRVVVVTSAEEAVRRYPAMEPFLHGEEALAAFPLVDGGEPLGAVALRFDVARTPQADGSGDASAGEALTRAVVPALVERVAQLQGALASRVVIEQAKGMLAERHGIPVDEAFERLRSRARSESRRVQQLAQEILRGETDL